MANEKAKAAVAKAAKKGTGLNSVAGWRPQALKSGEPVLDNQDAGIQLIYDLLDSELKRGANVAKGITHHQTQGIKSAYDTGDSLMKSASNTLQDQLSGLFDSIGIGDATGAALAGIRTDLAAGLTDQAKLRTGDLSAAMSEGNALYSVARQAITGAAREKAQVRTTAQTDLRKVLLEMRAQEEAARAQVELAKAEGAASVAGIRAGGGGGGGGDGLSQEDMLDIQNKQLDNEKLQFMKDNGWLNPADIYENQTGGKSSTKKFGGYGRGTSGVTNFMYGGKIPYWHASATPRFKNAWNDVVGRNYKSGMKRDYTYARFINRINKPNLYRRVNKNALREAAQIYWGKNG